MLHRTIGCTAKKRIKLKPITCVCLFIVSLLFPNMVMGQADATIKGAKNTAVGARDGYRKFQKFSSNDSLPWLYGGDATLSFTATSLGNWAGEDQIGISPIINLYANYKKGKRTFENYATFAYGFMKTGERKAVKSDDRLHFTTKLGHQISPKWYYTAALLMRTQFSPGYRYSASDTIRISDFLAPAYMFLSIGLDYRPSAKFSSVFSPVMGKATFARSNDMTVLSNAGLVKKEKDADGNDILVPRKPHYEFGGGMLINLNGNLFKNKVAYSSQLELFSNYAEKPQNVDVNWFFQSKILIYKNISADLRFDLKYDDDQKSTDKDGVMGGAKVQIKSYFGMGLSYQL